MACLVQANRRTVIVGIIGGLAANRTAKRLSGAAGLAGVFAVLFFVVAAHMLSISADRDFQRGEKQVVQGASSHWDDVYRTKSSQAVSWYQASADASLKAIDRLGHPAESLIDIGGGASVLVDQLIEKGWTDLSVLDLSQAALALSRQRLGAHGATVEWIVADIATWRPSRRYQVWHDRAVFHFLTKSADRIAYRTTLEAALPPGGNAIIATFALDGPERCSGLPVVRYDNDALADELGPNFVLIDGWNEQHETPGGSMQSFTWTSFKKA